MPALAVKVIELCWPHESSFEVTGVSALTAAPVYAASTVLRPEPQVVIVALDVVVGVSRYQTELSGVETPAWLGSPTSLVAASFVPATVPVAVSTVPLAQLSFAGGT